MNVKYDPDFIERLKKVDVRIRKSFKKVIVVFITNPNDFQLNNHSLREEWKGYRSIDVTGNWRAIYIEKVEGKGTVAYFVALGTHKELYKN